MEARNGLGGAPAGALVLTARKRYSVVPEFTWIEIERPNHDKEHPDDGRPETIVVALRAWPKGPRCLTSIEIDVEAANDAFREAVAEEEQRLAKSQEGGASAAFTLGVPMRAAGTTLHRDILKAVVPELTADDLEVLCSDQGGWLEILTDLGWWRRPTEADPTEEAESPEGVGETAAATVDFSPDSAPSMDPTTGST